MTQQEVGRFSKLNNFYKNSEEIACHTGVRSGFASSGLVVFLVGIPLGERGCQYYECCARSGTELWVWLINSPEGSY